MSLRLLLVSSSGNLFRSARLVGSLPRRSRLVRGAVASAALGAFSLVDPHTLTPWQRAGHRIVSASLAGIVGADLAREDPIVDPITDGVLLGGFAMALAGPAEELDGIAVEQLERLGVRHPRVLFALAGAAVTAATYAVAAHLPEDAAAWHELADRFDEEIEEELGDDLREIIDRLLGEQPQAERLRAQLATARRAVSWSPETIRLSVDEHLPRVLPRTQVWPVHGRFSAGGYRYRLDLSIWEGRLQDLSVVAEGDEDRAERAMESFAVRGRLPQVGQIELWDEADEDCADGD